MYQDLVKWLHRSRPIMGSIRFQLTMIFSLLIVTTLVVVLIISYYMVSADYEKKMYYNNAAIAESLASNIVQYMGNAYAVTELLAANPDLFTLSPEKQHEVLVDTTRRFSFLQLLAVHDLDGNQSSRSSGELANRSNRFWFQKFMTAHKPFITKTYYSVFSESPVTTIVHGLYQNNRLRGILMADIETGTLQDMVEKYSSGGEGAYAYLLDAAGVVVAHPDRTQVAELYNYRTMKKTILLRDDNGRMLKDEKGNEITREVEFSVAPELHAIVTRVMKGQHGVGEYTDLNGEQIVCAFRDIQLPGDSVNWSLIVVQKRSAALAFLKDLTGRMVLVGLGVLSVSAFLTFWFARRITRPLIEIVEATNQIKEGSLAVRIDDATTNEIGALATNFNQMVSELRQHREQLEEIAYHDALTGLPNRAQLNRLLEAELVKARRGAASGIILFIDMDDLKAVNDNFGHTLGDKVIIEAGRHIVRAAGDRALVARIGGDEFVVVLSGEAERERASELAIRIIRELCHEYEVSVERLQMSASIGVVLYPADGDIAEDVLKKADSAMYAAKQAGKNCWRFYEPAMQQESYERMVLTNSLRRALEREELLLYFQPQLAMPANTIVGFEALLRWNSAEFGPVPPERFIPLAEQSGQILPIGHWVLRETCRFARQLADMGRADIHVAVNISPRQLIAEDFVALVCATIEEAGIKPGQIELEITESVLLESLDDCVTKLEQLRAMGLNLSLDDFGTGYSSLTYLMNLPVSILKIDRSFIARIDHEVVQLQLVGSLINLGHSIGLVIVAEGVETETQLALLRQNACDRFQGYIFSEPVPAAVAIVLITEGAR